MIWGFAANTILTNLARDLGTRIVAAIFFGREASTFDNGYTWISILVNVPVTIFATSYYEFSVKDSLQKIEKGHAEHEDGIDGLQKHLSRVQPDYSPPEIEQGYSNALRGVGEGEEKMETV